MNLKDRNTTGIPIALVTYKGEAFYCMAEVEYWIVEYWNGYVDLTKGNMEEQYFNYLRRFKLDYAELKESYKNLFPTDDIFDIEGNKPKLCIDFNFKIFKSFFHEQLLETRMTNGWRGEFGNFEDIIPKELNYWREYTK